MDWQCESCGKNGTTVDGVSFLCCPECGKTVEWDKKSRYYKWYSISQEELKQLFTASKNLKTIAGFLITIALIGELSFVSAPLNIFLIGSISFLIFILIAVFVDLCRKNWSRITLQVISIFMILGSIGAILNDCGFTNQQATSGGDSISGKVGAFFGQILLLVISCFLFSATRKKELYATDSLNHLQLKYMFCQRSAGEAVLEEKLDFFACTRKRFFSYTLILFYLFLAFFAVTICLKGVRENNNADLLFKQGNAYLYGEGQEKNPAKALEYYEKGAKMGHGSSQAMLASYYLKGLIVPRDLQKGFDLAIQAANKNANIAYNLLTLYYMGEFGREVADSQKIYFWSKKEYDANMPVGAYHLAVCLTNGYGCKEDLQQAAMLYEKAANNGIEEGNVGLATLLLRGEGLPQDLEKGLRLAKNAADKGKIASYPLLAVYYLGLYNEKVLNPSQAFFWSDKAFKANLPVGKTCMALCIFNGYGCQKDETAGMRLLQGAAKDGEPLAKQIIAQAQSAE